MSDLNDRIQREADYFDGAKSRDDEVAELKTEIARLQGIVDGEKKKSDWLYDRLRWLKDWADAWHRQSGGYTATDTANGLFYISKYIKKREKEKSPPKGSVKP